MACTRFNLPVFLNSLSWEDRKIVKATICSRMKHTPQLLQHILNYYTESQIREEYAKAIDHVVGEYLRRKMIDPTPFLMAIKYDKNKPYYNQRKVTIID